MKKNKILTWKSDFYDIKLEDGFDHKISMVSLKQIKREGHRDLLSLLWWIIKTHFKLKRLNQSVIYTIVLPISKHDTN